MLGSSSSLFFCETYIAAWHIVLYVLVTGIFLLIKCAFHPFPFQCHTMVFTFLFLTVHTFYSLCTSPWRLVDPAWAKGNNVSGSRMGGMDVQTIYLDEHDHFYFFCTHTLLLCASSTCPIKSLVFEDPDLQRELGLLEHWIQIFQWRGPQYFRKDRVCHAPLFSPCFLLKASSWYHLPLYCCCQSPCSALCTITTINNSAKCTIIRRSAQQHVWNAPWSIIEPRLASFDLSSDLSDR